MTLKSPSLIRFALFSSSVFLAAAALAGCSAAVDRVRVGKAAATYLQQHPGHQVRVFYTHAISMEPTIHSGQNILVDDSFYESANPKDGDLVAFTPPLQSTSMFIKRVIASPGDTLVIRGGKIVRNGVAIRLGGPRNAPRYTFELRKRGIYVDGFRLSPAVANLPPAGQWSDPNRVPRGCYIVLGDNVNNSADSHVFGCAQFNGHFWSGMVKGASADTPGKVVKIL